MNFTEMPAYASFAAAVLCQTTLWLAAESHLSDFLFLPHCSCLIIHRYFTQVTTLRLLWRYSDAQYCMSAASSVLIYATSHLQGFQPGHTTTRRAAADQQTLITQLVCVPYLINVLLLYSLMTYSFTLEPMCP